MATAGRSSWLLKIRFCSPEGQCRSSTVGEWSWDRAKKYPPISKARAETRAFPSPWTFHRAISVPAGNAVATMDGPSGQMTAPSSGAKDIFMNPNGFSRIHGLQTKARGWVAPGVVSQMPSSSRCRIANQRPPGLNLMRAETLRGEVKNSEVVSGLDRERSWTWPSKSVRAQRVRGRSPVA